MKKMLVWAALLFWDSSFAQYIKMIQFNNQANGRYPWGGIVSDGTWLYGTTEMGGANDLGTLFRIKPDGTAYTKLLDFAGISNGSLPRGSLYYDGTMLYGMTYDGGVNDAGTIFKIMGDGTGYVKLMDFAGTTNGANPEAGGLISDGTYLYGVTTWGGSTNRGTIFKIKKDGTGYQMLLDFDQATSGQYPFGSLTTDGTYLYATASSGGANDWGTIIKVKHDGTGYQKLLDFAGMANGRNSYGGLVYDGSFLYGMSQTGGTQNRGVLFKLMPDGTGFGKLYEFAGSTDGALPYGWLIIEGGYLYGMTSEQGAVGGGNIFKIMPDGTNYSSIHDFQGAGNADGSFPRGGLLYEAGFLYGLTNRGGTNDLGMMFKTGLVNKTEDPTKQRRFAVYPNPARKNIVIDFGESENGMLVIYNGAGQIVHTAALAPATHNLDISHLASGLYWLILKAGLASYSKMLAIE